MFELVLRCTQNNDEILGDALMELGALSVSLEDANAYTSEEEEIFAEPGMNPGQTWRHGKLTALFDKQQQAQQAWQILSKQDFFIGTELIAIEPVQQQDWVKLTQSQFTPVEIAEDFWVTPSWSSVPEQAKKVIELDPGLAFGTGTHPTTKMCLRWIAKNIQPNQKVLDYGCGSGILAIAAAKFGATTVDAIDIDEVAVQAATENAKRNKVQINVKLPTLLSGEYDVVVANILAIPLKVLAPLLTNYLVVGGGLILAGILQRQQQELIDAYQPYVQLSVVAEEDGWILMTATKEKI